VLEALRSALKADPKIAADVQRALGLSKEELASTSLKYQTGKAKGRAFSAPLQGGIPEVVQVLERRAPGLRMLDIGNEADQETLQGRPAITLLNLMSTRHACVCILAPAGALSVIGLFLQRTLHVRLPRQAGMEAGLRELP
jgi:hypothetical protein